MHVPSRCRLVRFVPWVLLLPHCVQHALAAAGHPRLTPLPHPSCLPVCPVRLSNHTNDELLSTHGRPAPGKTWRLVYPAIGRLFRTGFDIIYLVSLAPARSLGRTKYHSTTEPHTSNGGRSLPLGCACPFQAHLLHTHTQPHNLQTLLHTLHGDHQIVPSRQRG